MTDECFRKMRAQHSALRFATSTWQVKHKMLPSTTMFAGLLLIILRSPKMYWIASKSFSPQMILHSEPLSTQGTPCSTGVKHGILFKCSYLWGVYSLNMVPRVNPCSRTSLRNLFLAVIQLLEVILCTVTFKQATDSNWNCLVFHASELEFLFGTESLPSVENKFSTQMQDFWITFVNDLDPGGVLILVQQSPLLARDDPW